MDNTIKKQAQMQKIYPVGTRIECVHMPDDPCPIEPGTEGTVHGVDGIGNLMMQWDNGRSLNLIPGVDQFRIIEDTTEQTASVAEHG